jgi:hypothetical protein
VEGRGWRGLLEIISSYQYFIAITTTITVTIWLPVAVTAHCNTSSLKSVIRELLTY